MPQFRLPHRLMLGIVLAVTIGAGATVVGFIASMRLHEEVAQIRGRATTRAAFWLPWPSWRTPPAPTS